jgi:hypothetical protein
VQTAAPIDHGLREAFRYAHEQLLYLAAKALLNGDEYGRLLALDGALIAFMREHQAEPLGPDDWSVLSDVFNFIRNDGKARLKR